jgi:signal transduction histidine kinase
VTEPAAPVRPDPVRVLIADEAAGMRALLTQFLALDPDVEVVGQASSGSEAAAAAAAVRPDVLLLDIGMPSMDGLLFIPEIRERSPATRIVVLSTLNGATTARQVAEAGAAASLSKSAGPDEVLATVHRVASTVTARSERPADGRRERDLLSFVTHEIGNQLTVIHGFAEMLADGLDELPKETLREFSQAIVRNAVEMRTLLHSLSDLRDIDEGGHRVRPQPVDLVPAVLGVVDQWRAQLGARPVSVSLPDRLVVPADADRIVQVVASLLSNVARHAPTGAAVAVELGDAGDFVELSVADDGPGIPAERVAEVFERFSGAGPALRGAGIGLYLSREIARAHGGDLVLDNGPRGCRFVLRLPGPAAGGQPDSASMMSPWR